MVSPFGRQICDATLGAESNYTVVGISATSSGSGVFSGVIYGVITYIVYWILTT